ncbi:MAG: S8 family serine peptidase [Solirubrobacterales bacterium]
MAAALSACALAPVLAGAKSPPAEPELSPRLAELAKPGVRGASRATQAKRLDLAPRGPGSLVRDGSRVVAEVGFDHGAVATVGALRDAGAEILDVSRRYQTVTVAARPAELPEIAAVTRVDGVTEAIAPVVRGVDCGGLVRSEGDTQLAAAAARAAYGVDGSGVTVGVLSDSFDRDATAPTHAAEDVASGDLPGTGSPCGTKAPVGMLDDTAGGGDEGRAMAQVVRDLAPGAAIDFATAFGSELGFASNVRALWEGGAEVIVDDVGYFAEPFFQDGPVAVAVDEVTAAGASYFSAAGNDNLFDSEGRSIASWETPEFRDAAACPGPLAALQSCLDFDPAEADDPTLGITVTAGSTLRVNLQWAEPWQGVDTDLDAYLLDAAGETVIGESTYDNPGSTKKPFEFIAWTNETGSPQQVQLAVQRCYGASCNGGASESTAPRLKVAFMQNGGGVSALEYPESSGGDVVGPTIYGHSGASGAISTGAIRYSATTAPEYFSSRGPVTHYFGPADGVTAAEPLAEAELIAKPDLVATDGGVNTFFGQEAAPDSYRFYGTSAAAPHAAAVAALVRDGNPAASGEEVREALTGTALAVGAEGAFGPFDVGGGRIDAEAAVGSLYVEPLPGDGSEEEESGEAGGEAEAGALPPLASTQTEAEEPGAVVTPVSRADTARPRTWFASHPRKLIPAKRRVMRLRFRFRSDEAPVTFFCKIDRRRMQRCGRRIARRFGVGRHVVRVRARDAAGNLDRTPAVFRFRVERRR